MAARMAAMYNAASGLSMPGQNGKGSPERELPSDLNTFNDERPRSGRGRREPARGRRADHRDGDQEHSCPLLEQLKTNK
eukprot:scaffold658995_cov32-Prasinocladus_malaysianus.AAC.1